MTTVADFGEFTDVDGVLTIDDVPIANVQYDVSWKRNVNKVPRSGARSQKNIPGYLEVTTKLKAILIHDNAAALVGASLNDTPITGAAETLLAASNVLDASDFYEDMTDDTIASPSRIRYTLQTKAVTVGGTITIIGEDASGNPLEEILTVPATMAINDTLTSKKLFKKVYGHTIRGVDSADDLGTFMVASITGASSFTVGDPLVFDLVGIVTKGSESIQVTQPDCWMAGGQFAWTEGGEPMDIDVDVYMYDPDLFEYDVIG